MRVSPPVRTIRSGSGRSGAVEMGGERVLVDRRRPSPSVTHLGGECRHRVGQLDPAVVVDGQRQRHAVVAGGHRLRLRDDVTGDVRHPLVPTSQTTDAHALPVELLAARQQHLLGVGERRARTPRAASPSTRRAATRREPAQSDAERAVDHVGGRGLVDAAPHDRDVTRDLVQVDVGGDGHSRNLTEAATLLARCSRPPSAGPRW